MFYVQKILLVLMLIFILNGCVNLTYNTKTNELKYNRVGDQQLDGFSVLFTDVNGKEVLVEIDGQKSEAKLLQDAISMALKIAEMKGVQ
jgi:VCBS repeat-containing protein